MFSDSRREDKDFEPTINPTTHPPVQPSILPFVWYLIHSSRINVMVLNREDQSKIVRQGECSLGVSNKNTVTVTLVAISCHHREGRGDDVVPKPSASRPRLSGLGPVFVRLQLEVRLSASSAHQRCFVFSWKTQFYFDVCPIYILNVLRCFTADGMWKLSIFKVYDVLVRLKIKFVSTDYFHVFPFAVNNVNMTGPI